MRLSVLFAACALSLGTLAAHASIPTVQYNLSDTFTANSTVYTLSGFITVDPSTSTTPYDLVSADLSFTAGATTYTYTGIGTVTYNAGAGYVEDSQLTLTSPGGDSGAIQLFYTYPPDASGDLVLCTGAVTHCGNAGVQHSTISVYNPSIGINSVNLSAGAFTPASVPSVTPEPSSLVLLGTGLTGFAGAIRRRFKK